MPLTPLLDALSAGPASDAEISLLTGGEPAAAIAALRAEGLGLEERDAGWALVDPAGFGPATLTWRCREAVHFFPSCDSTNHEARALARAGLHGVVVAVEQRAGRGRLGRTWQAEPGKNLTFTLILRPDLPAVQAPRAVLCWAAAMAEALDVQLKWPNDLVDPGGQKLGGILAELEVVGDRVDFVVLGVGVNVNQQEFPDLPQATSLSRLRGQDQDRALLLGQLVAAVRAADLAAPLDRWRSRNITLGRRVRVAGREGVATGLREDGALLVDGEAVLAGDVSLV